MATAAMDTIKSEDVLNAKIDRCLLDASIKLASGLAIGSLLSLTLFKRRSWPIVFAVGSGFGMAYTNCQNELNAPLVSSRAAVKAGPPAATLGAP